MATNVGEIKAKLGLDFSSFSSGLKSAGSQLQNFSGSIEKVGKKMTMGITVPLAASAAGAVTAAASFDSSMSKIQGLVGATSTEMGHLKEGVLELAGKTAKAPGELSEALFSLKSAGLDSAQSMDALELAAKASAAGLGDTQAVALTTASAMTAYRESGLTAAQATDILVATVREGNLSAEELAGSLSAILPIASQAGVGLDEVGASVAIITRSGASASEAVNGMRAAILAMNAPTAEAQKLLEEAGLSANELRRILAEDGVVAALQAVEKAADGDASKMRLMLGSVEALNAAAVLLSTEASTLAGVFDGVANSTGSLDAAFAVATDTAAFKFKAALQEMQATAIKFGEIMLPVAEKVLGFANMILDAFGMIPEPIMKIVVAAGALAAGMGPVLIVGAKLLGLLSKVSLAAQATGLAMSVLGDNAPASLGKLNSGFTRTQGALTKVTAGFGAVSAALGVGLVAYTAYTTAMDIANQAKERATERAEQLGAALDDLTRSYEENSAAVLQNMDVGEEAADAMDRLGISAEDIAKAAAGGTDAFHDLSNASGWVLAQTDAVAAMLEGALAKALEEGDENAAAMARRLIEMNDAGRLTVAELKQLTNALDESADAGDDWLETQKSTLSTFIANEAALRGWNAQTTLAAATHLEAANTGEEYHDVLRALKGGFFDLEGTTKSSSVELHAFNHAQELAANGAALFDGALVAAIEPVEEIAEEVDDTADKLAALAEAFFAVYNPATAVSNAFEDGEINAKKFREEMERQRAAIVNAAQNFNYLVDQGLEPLATHLNDMGPAGQAMMDELVTGIENGDRELLAEWERTWTEMQVIATGNTEAIALLGDSEFVETIQRFTTSGVRMGEGLINGILSMEDAIEMAAIQVGNKAASGLDWAIEVMSPSRRAARSGQYFGEGFVDGILAMADEVNAAGGSLGDKAAKALREGWEKASRDIRDALRVEGFEQQIIDIQQKQVAAIDEVQDAYHRAVDANEAVYRAELNLIEAKKEAIEVTDEEMRAIAQQVSTVEDLERAYALAQAEVNAMLDSQRALTDMSLSSAMSQASLELQIFKSQRKISDLGDEIDRAREKGEDFTEQSLELALEHLRVEEATRRLSVEQQTATTHAEELSDAFSRQMQASLDVKLAEEELARLREAAIGDTDAVREAEEDLRVKRLEAMKANQDYNAITATLAETQTQLQTDLLKVMIAIGDFIAQGGQWRSDMSLSGVATSALKDTALTNMSQMKDQGAAHMNELKNAIWNQMTEARLKVGAEAGAMVSIIDGLPTSKKFTYKIVTDTTGYQEVEGVTTGGHNFRYYGTPQFPARAAGGPVTAGQPYTVGERGIEVFVPNTSGKIVSNEALATLGAPSRGAQVNVTVNAGWVASEQQLRDKVVDAVRDAIRMNPDSLNP